MLVGVLLFILELMLPGFVLFFFGLGAWITALASWFLPIDLSGQLAIFIGSSLLSLLVLRGVIRNTFFGSRLDGGGDSALVRDGSVAVVLTAIEPPAEGKVKYSGSSWRATAGEKVEAGETVVIVKQDGLILRVRKLENADR
jgi:membrane protein implicated in regulation of membrane protease activity